MKITFNKTSGLTLIDVLVSVAVLTILAMILLPALAKSKTKNRISCIINVKQIGIAFRIWAGDNNGKYPMAVSTNQAGAMEFAQSGKVFQIFQSLQNELGTPKILVCPKDKQRKFAASLTNLSNANVSYFVGLDSEETLTNTILSGDRNITNGFAPIQDLLNLTTNQGVGFTQEIHTNQGNIALGDGSVQQVTSAQLRQEIIRNFPFVTNRIKLP